MINIFNLFGRSPFAPLQGHMEKVSLCVDELDRIIAALLKKDYPEMTKIADRISELEHAADLTKNEIRNQLSGSLFLSIDREIFFEMLMLQDKIADTVEDISVLLTIRKLQIEPEFEKPLLEFLKKNKEAFIGVRKIIEELNELLEASFGGMEAKKVKVMVENVAFIEHEADVIQRDLLKALYGLENKISYGIYIQWQKIFELIGTISNISEKLADCVRMTLEVK